MKKLAGHIALVLVLTLFLVSSTGVYLTIHHCNDENLTALFFFVPLDGEPCEHHLPSTCDTSSSHHESCTDDPLCNHPDIHSALADHDCCSDKVLFININDDFVRPEFSENISLLVCYFPEQLTGPAQCSDFSAPVITYPEYHPPGKPWGKDIVFTNLQLLL